MEFQYIIVKNSTPKRYCLLAISGNLAETIIREDGLTNLKNECLSHDRGGQFLAAALTIKPEDLAQLKIVLSTGETVPAPFAPLTRKEIYCLRYLKHQVKKELELRRQAAA